MKKIYCEQIMEILLIQRSQKKIIGGKVNMDNHNYKNDFAAQTIEIFENFLDDRNIILNNDEKDEDENAANIYGSDYGELQTEIEGLLDAWGVEFVKKEVSELQPCVKFKCDDN